MNIGESDFSSIRRDFSFLSEKLFDPCRTVMKNEKSSTITPHPDVFIFKGVSRPVSFLLPSGTNRSEYVSKQLRFWSLSLHEMFIRL